MNTKIITSSKIVVPENKRKCMLPLRIMYECYKCDEYKNCDSRVVDMDNIPDTDNDNDSPISRFLKGGLS